MLKSMHRHKKMLYNGKNVHFDEAVGVGVPALAV